MRGNLDPKFKFEVAQMPGGETIKYCFQCGKCVAACPVGRFEDYSPIKILRATFLGLKETVLSSDIIWRCLTCKACTEICPSGVKFTEFIEAVRRIAIEEGVTEYILRCKRCGKSFTTTPILELVERLLPKEIKLDGEALTLCPSCRRYGTTNKLAQWYERTL